MGKMNNDLLADDDSDVIFLSSDEDEEEIQNNGSAKPSTSLSKQNQAPSTVTVRSDVKIEDTPPPQETLNSTSTHINNYITSNESSSETEDDLDQTETTVAVAPPPTIHDFGNFSFDAFALFGPENSAMPIEERLASFINNVQSLTEEKIKLENAEKQAKQQYDEATNQLTTANQEITKLKDDLGESQRKLNQQKNSISELQTVVEKLKKQDTGSKGKLKTITSTLVNLQEKMVKILEETEMDSPSILSEQGTSSTALSLTSGSGNGSLAEAVLKENIENFEKDFETKFSQIEEQDKEIKDELLKTNEMLQRIQSSLMQQFQMEGSQASSSPLLTFESMEDQDMGDEHLDQAPSSSTSVAPRNGITKKVSRNSRQEDSERNINLIHARDSKRKFACVCGVRYGTKYSIERHLRMENGQKHFACTLCTDSFFELCHLRKHYESAHQLHYTSKVAGCTACGKIFTSFEVFQTHRRRCDGRNKLVDP